MTKVEYFLHVHVRDVLVAKKCDFGRLKQRF